MNYKVDFERMLLYDRKMEIPIERHFAPSIYASYFTSATQTNLQLVVNKLQVYTKKTLYYFLVVVENKANIQSAFVIAKKDRQSTLWIHISSHILQSPSTQVGHQQQEYIHNLELISDFCIHFILNIFILIVK